MMQLTRLLNFIESVKRGEHNMTALDDQLNHLIEDEQKLIDDVGTDIKNLIDVNNAMHLILKSAVDAIRKANKDLEALR